MRRAVLPWLAAIGVALLASAVAVVVLNATAFGAGSFVRAYLEALARGDAASAVSLPGVDVPDGDTAFVDDDVLMPLRDIEIVQDEAQPDGGHVVVATWATDEGPGTTRFEVERIGTRFALFPEWGFARSPVAEVSLAVLHDPRFTVNGEAATSAVSSDDPGTYSVLVPGAYTFDHESHFLEADAVTVVADEPGATIEAELDIRANERFVEQVEAEVHEHLDECATQRVLFPSGCPLGRSIDNRVISEPEWSIVEYPELEVEPTRTFGEWEVPTAHAVAHLVVEVQSLFDGTVSTIDEDMTVPVRYRVTIEPDDRTLRITAVYD